MTETSTVVAKGYLEDCMSIDTRCSIGLGSLSVSLKDLGAREV